MFGSSFVISYILKFLAGKGLEYIQAFSEAHKAEVEAYVKAHVPSVLADAAWKVVELVWDELLVAAKMLADQLIGGVSHDVAVAHAVSSMAPAVEKAQAELHSKGMV